MSYLKSYEKYQVCSVLHEEKKCEMSGVVTVASNTSNVKNDNRHSGSPWRKGFHNLCARRVGHTGASR